MKRCVSHAHTSTAARMAVSHESPSSRAVPSTLIVSAPLEQTFHFLQFMGLAALPLTLFVSAALLLRFGEEAHDQRAYFENGGKWALLSLSAFFAGALVVNWQLFHATPLALWGLIDVALIALPPVIAFTNARAVHVAVTAITVPLIAADTVVASYYA